jgi:hypothetical protein
MDREITVAMTPQLLMLTIFYQSRVILLICAFSFFWVFINLGLFVAHGGVLTAAAFISDLPPAIIFLVVCFILYSSYSKSLAQIQKMKNPEIKYRFTDDSVYIESDLASAPHAWDAFKGLKKHPRLWRLITKANTSFALPVELLDRDLKTFLSSKFPN